MSPHRFKALISTTRLPPSVLLALGLPSDRPVDSLGGKPPCLVHQMEMPVCLFGSPRRAACLLPGGQIQERACVPDGDQCPLNRRGVQGRPAQTFRGTSATSTSDFVVFLAFRRACAMTIVSSIPAAPFSSKRAAILYHPSGIFSREFTKPLWVHIG
jgi:hypothetical protein